jgi:ParB-like chromosome segregation protein Spo0J
MAVDFKVEHTRTSEYLIPPENIRVNPEYNGRHEVIDIEPIISSFLQYGQLQPILIGSDGGIPVVRDGNTRWRVAMEINKRNLVPGGFKLRCVYLKGDAKLGFLATIQANKFRNDPTPISDAHNIATMERWGKSHAEIADIYGESVEWVKGRLALLNLSEEAADAFREGRFDTPAALEIAKLSRENQIAALEKVPEGKKLTKAAAKQIAKGETESEPKPKALSVSATLKFLDQVAAEKKTPAAKVSDLAASLIRQEMALETFTREVNRLFAER